MLNLKLTLSCCGESTRVRPTQGSQKRLAQPTFINLKLIVHDGVMVKIVENTRTLQWVYFILHHSRAYLSARFKILWIRHQPPRQLASEQEVIYKDF